MVGVTCNRLGWLPEIMFKGGRVGVCSVDFTIDASDHASFSEQLWTDFIEIYSHCLTVSSTHRQKSGIHCKAANKQCYVVHLCICTTLRLTSSSGLGQAAVRPRAPDRRLVNKCPALAELANEPRKFCNAKWRALHVQPNSHAGSVPQVRAPEGVGHFRCKIARRIGVRQVQRWRRQGYTIGQYSLR